MGLFSRKKAPDVGLYGKHPSASDFLRLNASSAELREFDQWLSNAIDAASRVAEAAWEQRYHAGEIVNFLFSGEQKRSVLGSFIPSRDQSGRLFPLILFAEVDRQLVAADYPALPHHPFFGRARALLSQWHIYDRDSLMMLPGRIPSDELNSFEGAKQTHLRYLDAVRCGSAFGAMFGGGSVQAPLAVAELKAFGRALSGRAPRYGLKMPLSQPAAGRLVSGPSVEGNAALWLELLRRHASRPILPSVIWTEAFMIVGAVGLPQRALLSLWLPEVDDDQICDLHRGQLRGPAASFTPNAPLSSLLRPT